MIIGGLIFVLGLIFGSFLNAWEYRLEAGKSLAGRSYCPNCKKTISWYDNIPVISWIILRGKCRQCHKPISFQYPAVELLTGMVFFGLWIYSPEGKAINDYLNSILDYQGANLQLPSKALLSLAILYTTFYILSLVALYDAKTKYVLTKYVYMAAILGIVYRLKTFSGLPTVNEFYPYVLAILVPYAIFWTLSKVTKERVMGSGDADIVLSIGALLGWALIIPAYYFAFITGALYGVYILLNNKGNMKSEIPLGPFLIAGAFFAFIYGQQIIDWYLGIVLGI